MTLKIKGSLRLHATTAVFLETSSRPPSVRVDHGYSILIVCLAGASAAMTVKANA